MWSLWIFGDNVEDRLGHVRYLLFYLLCGIAASAVHLLSDRNSPIPTVGASGAIAGVMGAYLLLYPRATVMTLIPFGFFSQIIAIPAVYFLLFWFGLQFVSGTLSATGGEAGGVAWWAHIGGFATGAAITGLFLLLHLTNPKVNASRPNSQPYRRERYFAG
jgi:membrane associated rhomboid family serine protease